MEGRVAGRVGAYLLLPRDVATPRMPFEVASGMRRVPPGPREVSGGEGREREAGRTWCGVADVVVVGARARPSGTRKAETQRHSRAVTSTAPMSAATNSFTGRARSTRATSAHPAIVSNDASVFSSYSALPHLPHA